MTRLDKFGAYCLIVAALLTACGVGFLLASFDAFWMARAVACWEWQQ